MTLIKSISGIRGTIGGHTGDTLNPLDIVKFTTAYATFIRGKKIVVGRDGRISGPMVRDVVCGTLVGMGYEVIDIGLATTPTTELAVRWHEADGGIIITASQVLRIAEAEDFDYAPVEQLGHVTFDDTMNQRHVDSVLQLRLADVDAIRKRHFRVCADTINSVGGIILPQLFEALGVSYEILNGECTGQFAHNPEPLEKNLQGIMERMKSGDFDLGIVVDPDVDRLAFICEDGRMFGEEYTLVSVADYVLAHDKGNTVSNLSSTRALRDVTERHGGQYTAAAVGEVNVTTKMKEVGAVIGGEGNGGVIYPESHYGRDALVGIALFLSSLAQKGCTVRYINKGKGDVRPRPRGSGQRHRRREDRLPHPLGTPAQVEHRAHHPRLQRSTDHRGSRRTRQAPHAGGLRYAVRSSRSPSWNPTDNEQSSWKDIVRE